MLGAGIDVDFWPTYDEYGGKRGKTTSIPPPIKVVSVLSSIGFKWNLYKSLSE